MRRPRTVEWLMLILGAVALLGGCAGLFGAQRSALVGDRPCPPGTQKAGGPPPEGNIESCVQGCRQAPPPASSLAEVAKMERLYQRRPQTACLNGPYRSWTQAGALRAIGEMGAAFGPTGAWTFLDADGSKALTCDLGKSPAACTEFKEGAAEQTAPVPLKFYIGGLTALADHTDRMAFDVLDSGGGLREHRLYSPNGTLMVTCPPSHVVGFHQYTQNRQSTEEHDFEAYCMQQPPNPCDRDSCVRYTGLHCEKQGGDWKCVPDAPLMDGTYRYWSHGRNLTEEGTYRTGIKMGEWTKFLGNNKEVTTYDDQGRRVAGRLVTPEGQPAWEATYDGEKFVSVARALPEGGWLHVRATGGEHPFSCEFRDANEQVIGEGPCSTNDPITGEVLKQGAWKEFSGGKRSTVRYVDGVSEQERREAEQRARVEAKERERERQAALARGECEFNGYVDVECELRLCASIASKVRTMQPDTRCNAGEPLDSYRSDWGQALRAIDTYAGVLRSRGDIGGFQRLMARVKLCQTPQWFRSCSN
ncbi:MAG: hypothetical protein AMXMBFR64_39450 [Myxococcales bacterium]